MQFAENIVISSSPEKVFSLYADVKNWSCWDPDVKNSSINGAFISGASGTLEPTKGPKAHILFTDVIQNRLFTVEAKLPLCKIRFEHEIDSTHTDSVNVIHRVTFDGILSPVFGTLVGRQIKKALPSTLLGLKTAAERNN